MTIFKFYLNSFNLHKYVNWLYFVLAITGCMTANAAQTPAQFNSPINTLTLGTPASFLKQLEAQGAKSDHLMVDQTEQTSAKFTLTNSKGQDIHVIADNLSIENNGTLTMEGQVEGITNSKFIIQGNEKRIYGWVIFNNENIAYEYTTQDDELVVQQVAITDIHPICNFVNHNLKGHAVSTHYNFPMSFTDPPHLGTYAGEHVGQLESKPDSDYVIFLDTRKIMSNGVPYDVSKEFIWTTWQITSASFSMFDVNVTTNKAVYDNAAPSKRGGATMYRETGRSSCHFAFGTSTFCTLYRENDAYGQGRIAAHELGHLFHLSHDGGQPGGEYFNGLADFQWVPVMGNIWKGNNWTHALYQWSKGEYYGASNQEDDFSIIQGFIPLKADDIPGNRALTIDSNGSVNAVNNYGQIERNTDTDRFNFTVGEAGGHVNLTIDRIEHLGGGMLDVQAYITDSSGDLVGQSNKNQNRSASFDLDLSAGNYTLEIRGGAEGTASHGFSSYSSVGYYAIEGSITGSDNTIPGLVNLANGATLTGSSQLFSWHVGDATEFKISAGSTQGATDYYSETNPLNTTSHTVTGLPVDGTEVHVAFHYLIDEQWSVQYYQFIAFNEDQPGEVGLISPVDGEVLTGASQVFTWEPGQASGFWFYAGSTRGAKDYYRNSSQLSGTSHTVSGLPLDGSVVHITFHYLMDGQWSQLYYSYTAADMGCTSAPDIPSKPLNTVNSATSFTADWNSVHGASSYDIQLWINDSEWQTIDSSSQSEYVFTELPAASTQYVRVNAHNSCGSSNYSQWSEVTLPGDTCDSAPDVPSGLTGNSQTINWNKSTGATRYDIQYWTGVWTDHGNTTNTSYSLGLSGTQYTRVRAVNSCGNSNYSAWITLR